MISATDRTPLPWSAYAPVAQATLAPQQPDGGSPASVLALLRRGAHETLPTLDDLSVVPRTYSYLTRSDFAATYGADPEDVTALEAFAADYGLSVEVRNQAGRLYELSGTVDELGKAFGVQLGSFVDAATSESYQGHEGAASVPNTLAGVITALIGLNQPPVKVEVKSQGTSPGASPAAAAADAAADPMAALGFRASQVAELYRFPDLTGKGQCIGVIALGGGYLDSDFATFFGDDGPSVQAVGANLPSPTNATDHEIALDVEVVGDIAKDAEIVVYFPSQAVTTGVDSESKRGETWRVFEDQLLSTLGEAVYDAERAPSVISVSYGWFEDVNTPGFLRAVEEMLHDAALMGVTVCSSSGDHGSYGMSTNTQQVARVLFPASCPWLLSVGGTQVETSDDNKTLQGETLWSRFHDWGGKIGGDGTGGGFSKTFKLPGYQKTAVESYLAGQAYEGVAGLRGVPDIAANASTLTGYSVYVNGQYGFTGGTSASTPLWAALFALANEALQQQGKAAVGLAPPLVYALTDDAFNAISPQGANGANGGPYAMAEGWTPCTGLGSPKGEAIVQQLGHLLPPIAGAPTDNAED